MDLELFTRFRVRHKKLSWNHTALLHIQQGIYLVKSIQPNIKLPNFKIWWYNEKFNKKGQNPKKTKQKQVQPVRKVWQQQLKTYQTASNCLIFTCLRKKQNTILWLSVWIQADIKNTHKPARLRFCCMSRSPQGAWLGNSGYNTSSAPSWCLGSLMCCLWYLYLEPCSFWSGSI